jgi:CRP/FNR family transcriptional regulator
MELTMKLRTIQLPATPDIPRKRSDISVTPDIPGARCDIPRARPAIPETWRTIPATQPDIPKCADCALSLACHGDRPNRSGSNNNAVVARRFVRRGQMLYRSGDDAMFAYLIVYGTFKLRRTHSSGKEHIPSFPFSGDVLGLDAIADGKYHCDAIALEDSQLCVVSLSKLLSRCRDDERVQHAFNGLMANALERESIMAMLLSSLSADERMAAFLCGNAQRMADAGYSSREFNLRMSREDIGCHLGMKLETVSRVLSKLQAQSILAVHQRHIEIRDPSRLAQLAGH